MRLPRSLHLPDGDRTELDRRATDPSLRLAERRRARIVLLAADGASNTEIAARLGVSRPTVIAWRGRYERDGLPGLSEVARPGRPHRLEHQAIICATLHTLPSPEPAHQWTCRSLACQLGVSGATVARVWQRYGVVPQPKGLFRFDTVPPLEARAVHVAAQTDGRYGKVAVLRLDGPGPATPDNPGTVLPVAVAVHRRQDDRPALAMVRACVDATPSVPLHVVADPVGRVQLRSSPAARAWWETNRRVRLHSVSRSLSWDLLMRAWQCGGPVPCQAR